MKKVEETVLQTLKGEIDFLMKQLNELDKKLGVNVKQIDKHEHLVTAAYHLSSIYSCLEDIFSKIAKVFENRIENPASWHKELLERMRIEVPKIRPSVLSIDIFSIVNEFRAFRHVFKSSYVFNLDKSRVRDMALKWEGNKDNILKEISAFIINIGCK
ncbi:MAG: hypothetical protein ABIA04_02995 [Pseudomonadota bacterium]